MQNIKSNVYFFSQFFPIIYFWWKICYFLVIFIHKRFNFYHSLWIFFFVYDLTRLLQHTESICYLFYWYYCYFFVFYPIRRMYIWSTNNKIFDMYITIFIHCEIFWYLIFSELQGFSIIFSASSLIMISMLSLFECITCSLSLSSLEEIKLIFIVDWIFHVSDFFDHLWCLLNTV